MIIKEVIKNSRLELNDAMLLLKYVLDCDEVSIVAKSNDEISDDDLIKFQEAENKVLEGYPLQYITNKQYFYENEFYVNENVLIPQPDTEILVQEVVDDIVKNFNKGDTIKILDLCTGSGAIAISIKDVCEKAGFNIEMYASDISSKALEVAKINSKNILDDENKIYFIESDMFDKIKDLDIKFDYIVSNPPYIKTDVISTLDKDVQNEPHLALDGGKDGLKFYSIIKDNCFKYLNDNGKVYLEIGYDQKEDLENLFKDYKVKCIKDFANNDRVVIIEK